MNAKNIQDTVLSIVQECIDLKSTNNEASLFSSEYGFQACDMAYLLIKIHEQYDIPMTMLVQELDQYSIKEIVHCVECFLQSEVSI